MVKEGYKEVKALGEKYIIPEEWRLKELNEVLTVIRNGSSKKQNKQGEGLPVSRIETIADGTINYDKVGYVDVEPEDLNKHELEKGDILFSHINSVAHIGKVAQYKADKKLYHGMNLLKLRFDNEKVTDQFMLHRLKSVNAKHFYERYAKQAVNQASLNQNDVGLYTFPLPPLTEQKKISSILSSVDKSIEKTDEVIEETKKLKKGLMQELLTKGIGHSEFKEVKALGKKYTIPKNWRLKKLNEVLTVIRNGSSKKQNKQGEGLPVSRIETIADGTINYDKIGYVDLESEDLKKHKLEKGDILFSHINSVAHIGKVAQYKADKKLYHGMNLLKLRFDNEKVTDQFMLHRLKSVNAKHFYERYAKQAVNQASLNQKDVGLYTFPVPPLEEQKKIASILSSVDAKIKKEEEYKAKLERLKKGLMQKLLTGEIRVNTDMEV